MYHSSHSSPSQHIFTPLLSRKKSLRLSKSDSYFEQKLYVVSYSPKDLFFSCAQVHFCTGGKKKEVKTLF